ncbi:MAG: hypothetical protein NVS4B2_19430 [Chloroflexota bacterium]
MLARRKVKTPLKAIHINVLGQILAHFLTHGDPHTCTVDDRASPLSLLAHVRRLTIATIVLVKGLSAILAPSRLRFTNVHATFQVSFP